MKKLITIVLILLAQLAFGQNWLWDKQFTQSATAPLPLADDLDIYDVKLSGLGNLYVTGSYKSHFTLSGTTYNGYPDATATTADIFLAKFDSNGNVLWVKTAGSTGGDLPEAIVIDANENVYLAGRYQGTCNFGGGNTLTQTGGQDGFIAKYNASGVFQWAKKVAYGTANDRITGITIGTDGLLYTVGMTRKTTAGSYSFTVGDGTLETSYTNSDQYSDLYIASYNTNGSYRWSKQIPCNGDNSIFRSITTDNENNLYTGGALIGTMTIDGIPYTSAGSGDIIFLKASPTNGTAEWVRKGGGTNDDQLNSIAVYDNYSYLIGYIQSNGTIDSTATKQSSSITLSGTGDIFLAKYNLEGRLIWKKNIGGTGYNSGYGLNVYNNILVATGYFSNTINFNLNSITSGGNTDAGFFVFDVESNAVIAKNVSGGGEDRGQGVALDSDYNVYLGGYFKSASLTIGTNTLTNSSSPSTTYKDIFLAKHHNEYTAAFTQKKNVSCNGSSNGELTVTPYFGKPPYTYEWLKDSNPFTATDSALTNLAAGVYQVTVTDDNNEEVILSSTITQPSALLIGKTSSNVSCFGLSDGSINITVSGGTAPYTYFWTTENGCGHDIDSEDQTGLSNGIYSVEVTDANGCASNDNITITQPTQINITGIVTNITGGGSNGEVNTSVSGGSGTYSTYAWKLDGTPIAPATEDITGLNVGGNYEITVTDNTTCSNSKSFAVLDTRDFHAWISAQTNIDCKGDATGSATVSYADNTGSVSILWSSGEITPGISGKTANTYTATLTDNMGTPGDTGDDKVVIVTVTLTEPLLNLGGTIFSTPATCYGSANGILDLTPTGGTGPYTYSWNTVPAKSTQDVNNLLAGNYQVTITDSKGCEKIVAETVSQPTEITFGFTSVQPLCYGGSNGSLTVKDLTGGVPAYSYLWSNTLSSTTISNLKSGNYWLKVTDSDGCFKTINTNLGQPSDITISHIENKPTCPESKNGSIGLTVTGGTGVKTYFWTGPDIINATDKDQTNLGVGTYSVRVTDENSCIKDYEIIVTSQNSTPTAGISSSETDNTICAGDNTIFTATGGSTYEFFLNGGSIQAESSDATFNTTTLANNDEVYAIVTSSFGCKATSATITTTVNPLPTVTLADLTAVCVDASPITLDGGLPAGGTYTGTGVSGASFDPATATAGTHTITYTFTDGNSCINSALKDITVNPLPVVSLSDLSPICIDALPITLNGGLPVGGTYTGTGVTGTSFDPAIATAGTHTITYTFTDGNSCSNFVSKNITVNALPVVTLADFSPICIDASPITLDGGLPAGGTYTGTGVSGATFDPATAGAGTHTITYTFTDGNSCSNFVSKNITVNALPVVTLADFSPICINASPITLDGGLPAGGTYTGTGVSGTTFDPATAGVGTYTITYTYTDANSCVSSASKDITVKVLPTPTITTTDPLGWCEGASITVNFTTETADAYQWILNGTDITGANSQTYTGTLIGNYSVRSTINGCAATSSETIISTITQSITVTTTGPTTWCANDEVSVLLQSTPTGGQSYQWTKDAVDISGATQSEYTTTEPGVYAVKATFTGGCNVSSNNITLTENSIPVIDIATDTVRIKTNSSATLDAGAGFTSYLWNDNSTQQTLLVDGAVLGEGIFKYWVRVTNELSCTASDTAIVKVTLWNNIDIETGWVTKIYPNPTSGEFKLHIIGIKSGEYQLSIYNSTGGIVINKTEIVLGNEFIDPISINKLPKGIYLIKFGGNNKWITRKIILE